jgi:hypothetical protein
LGVNDSLFLSTVTLPATEGLITKALLVAAGSIASAKVTTIGDETPCSSPRSGLTSSTTGGIGGKGVAVGTIAVGTGVAVGLVERVAVASGVSDSAGVGVGEGFEQADMIMVNRISQLTMDFHDFMIDTLQSGDARHKARRVRASSFRTIFLFGLFHLILLFYHNIHRFTGYLASAAIDCRRLNAM